MKKEITKFFNEGGKPACIVVEKTVTAKNGQIWKVGSTRDCIDWVIPVGFPNNDSPRCRESDEEGYSAIADLEN